MPVKLSGINYRLNLR